MRERANIIEGMSDILARAYARKTGKDLAVVKSLMDSDTFFFGEEMKTEGFVDEIIDAADGDDDDDKASAIVKARLTMDACLNRISESKAANDDIQKAVAYFEGMSALTETIEKSKPATVAIIEKPALAEDKPQEVKHMATFLELMAENPGAKAEHDALIVAARTEGATAAKAEVSALVEKVKPILESAEYGENIKAFGTEVILGTKTIDGFEAIVFIEDQKIEAKKAADAADETGETEETVGAAGDADAVAVKAAFDAKLKRTAEGA